MAVNQNKNDLTSISQALEEISSLEHRLRRIEQESRMLRETSENAERLRQNNEREKKLQYLYNDLLLENCPNMLFVFNEELRFVLCSQACLPLLRSEKRSELKRVPLPQIFTPQLEPTWIGKVREQCEEVLAKDAVFGYEDTLTFSDGSFIHAQVALSPIFGEGGEKMGVLLNINDITELAETRQRAEEAARSKSSFLANMSHEIRTPMNAIKGLSELLSLTRLDGLQRNYVDNIISSANSLISIINDVLDFSKIDANKIELLEGPYSVAELLAEAGNVIGMRREGKSLLLLAEAAPTIPAELWGDEVRIKQVLLNLLTNAVKYTREGFVRLRMNTEPGEDGSLKLVCSVEDSGIGIRSEDLPQLFEAFSRADLHTNRNIAGTGLGLAISKQLALAMGGDITVESEYEKGSTFTFWVPQKVVDPAPLARVENPGALRVLLLGNPTRMQSIGASLKALGVPFTALSGGEALAEAPAAALPAKENFTHCIYDDTVAKKTLRAARGALKGCLYGALRDMQGALDAGDEKAALLFTPLLVTDLARFLSHSAESQEAGEEKLRPAGALSGEVAVQRTTLLVVDDNEVNLMVSGEMLRAFGAEVEFASGGEEALVKCALKKYDIIFLDHMMPGMDGIETTTALRGQAGPNQQTPIVALTANVVNDMQSYYVRHGMDDFLGKPVEFSELARVLVRWLPPDKIVPQGTPPVEG